MRLICPNCGAQYEVPDDVIPAEGRDVQCSNCGDTWFQSHPDARPVAEPDADHDHVVSESHQEALVDEERETFEEVEPPEASFDEASERDQDLGGADWNLEDDFPTDGEAETTDPDWQQSIFDEDEASETPSGRAEDSVAGDPAEVAEDPEGFEQEEAEAEEASTEDDIAPSAKRRGLDPAVADVLQEEAAHEARVRAEEQETLETQAELGLSAPVSEATRRASEARDRMRTLRGQTGQEEPASSATSERRDSRRDLLPDIEETNSTLRHAGETNRTNESVDASADDAKRGRGFRLGFVLIILLATASVLVYGRHESLSAAYPQFAPQIDSFVTSADTARVWLDTKVSGLLIWMNEIVNNRSDG